ncbi:radial spoke head 14 homolog [Hippopotamus amphibius kiboko]|uniref:radial spoke head 14 homolog n=1 Tax=Hippopotamus amphibius kiboko TaxID=575201 RepID=UPI0025968BA2|nr:radial spoke head 14 homolog [Hippopotamus amphibius kiboko]
MAHAQISMYLPPDVNPTQAATAYGCRALPKLNEELQSEDLLTRQKALVALCDLMHDPEHVYTAISIGCLESLKALLKDTNDLVRVKTTEALYIMATHNVGRDGFLEHDVIRALSFLLDDPQSACRENLHLAFKHLALLPAGRLAVGARAALGLLARASPDEASWGWRSQLFPSRESLSCSLAAAWPSASRVAVPVLWLCRPRGWERGVFSLPSAASVSSPAGCLPGA